MPESVTYVSGLRCYLCPRSVPSLGHNKPLLLTNAGVFGSGRSAAAFFVCPA